MSNTYAVPVQPAWPLGYGGPIADPAGDKSAEPNNVGMGVAIWTPAAFLAICLILFKQPGAALIVGGIALLVHTLLLPRVATYCLIMAIPVDWMVAVIPGVTSMTKLLGALAMLVSVPRLIAAAHPAHWDKSGKWMIVLIGWAALSFAWCQYPQFALFSWQSLALTWGITVLICLHFTTRSRLRLALLLYLLASAFAACTFLFTGDRAQMSDTSARDSVASVVNTGDSTPGSNVNKIAREFAVGLTIAVYFLVSRKGVLRRLALLGMILAYTGAILLLKTRAMYLGVPLALAGGVMLFKGGGLSMRFFVGAAIALIMGAALYLAGSTGMLGKAVVARFESIFEEGADAGHRSTLWAANARACLESGGLGAGFEQMQLRQETMFLVAHSDYFAIMGELGLVGLTCFFMFHFSLFRRVRELPDRWLNLFGTMLQLLLLWGGLTQDNYTLKFYALSAGFLLAIVRCEEEYASRNSYCPMAA